MTVDDRPDAAAGGPSSAWLTGPRTVLVPVTADHVTGLRSIRRQPEVLRWWRELEDDFPLADEPDAVRYTILLRPTGSPGPGEADGRDPGSAALQPAPRGMIEFHEENEPDYRHAGIDLFLDRAVHGRGLGREVVAVLADHLVRVRGHHRLTIDPAADNGRAIACYAAVGFRPVGRLRQYERGSDGVFQDGLLMDALAQEILTAARDVLSSCRG
jgi:aminoglycoside 6'-N-acetyltransferase